jgi:WD40 repeat protein
VLARILLACAALAALPAAAQAPCPARLFVSGWFSTVHVFDACTGQYLRDLDTRSRLAGAMAVRLGPDGLLYAVAETTGVVQTYRNDTLDYVGPFAQVPGIGATGLVFDVAGIAYVDGYDSQDVKRFDRSGAPLGPAFPARASGLGGPDNGMTFGPDGNLYLPGWDSNNVVRWNPGTGETSVAVASRTAGLFHARGLLVSRDGQSMFITSEGSGTVLKWRLATGEVSVLASGLTQPTGIDYAMDGKLLVSNADAVVRIDPGTGQQLSTFIPNGTGGISGQVFLAVIPTATPSSPVSAKSLGSRATASPVATLFGGFELAAASTVYILVRGNSLGTLGVTQSFLDSPRARLFDSQGRDLLTDGLGAAGITGCGANQNSGGPVVTYYTNVRSQPPHARDACTAQTLPAGVYTFTVTPSTSGAVSSPASGEILFEVTLGSGAGTITKTLGSRATVAPGATLFGGFELAASAPVYVLVRGNSLGTLGVTPSFLDSPRVRLFDSQGRDLATDNLGAPGFTGCTNLNSAGPVVGYYTTVRNQAPHARDACTAQALPAGIYTFSVTPSTSGAVSAPASGEVLFEVTLSP